MIIDHTSDEYQTIWNRTKEANRYNGAYYYSMEIVGNIIPRVETDRNWVTINTKTACADHSIVFVHNNKHPYIYNWLAAYHDLVLVCGIRRTCKGVSHLGETIHLPLSVDVEYVKQFRSNHRSGVAFAGRPEKRNGVRFTSDVQILEGLPRPQMLERLAQFESVYAVGRTAIEAKVLGCKVLPYDKRFPDPDIWKVMDNSEAAVILQDELDKIDGRSWIEIN